MTEQDYKDRLAVRSQLSLRDQLELLEYEFHTLIEWLRKQGIPETANFPFPEKKS